MTAAHIENYAVAHGLSNNAAKRAYRTKVKRQNKQDILVVRGAPVAGTGKPRGESKK